MAGSSINIDDILLSVNNNQNFSSNQYEINITEFPSGSVLNSNNIVLSIETEEIEVVVTEILTGCSDTKLIDVSIVESNANASFTNTSSNDTLYCDETICFVETFSEDNAYNWYVNGDLQSDLTIQQF